MKLEKRIQQLERTSKTVQLRFPGFLLTDIPEYLRDFHDSGQLAKYLTHEQAGRALMTGTIYETIEAAYAQHKKTARSISNKRDRRSDVTGEI